MILFIYLVSMIFIILIYFSPNFYFSVICLFMMSGGMCTLGTAHFVLMYE